MDINETIVDFLRDNIASVHIGETVPQTVATNYIYLQRQGDNLGEQLNYPPSVESISFDLECVSLDIDAVRTLTETAKELLRTYTMHSLQFEINDTTTTRKIVAFDVEDHSDDYVPHSIQENKNLHLGAFRLTAYLGDPFIND